METITKTINNVKTISGNLIIGYTEDREALEININYYARPEGLEIAISGSQYNIVTEHEINEKLEDYWNNIDVQSEFDYLFKESGIDPEDTQAKNDFFEGLEYDLRNANYPYEITHIEFINGTSYVFDPFRCGRVINTLMHAKPLIDPADVYFIETTWRNSHLKGTTTKTIRRMNEILTKYNSRDTKELMVNMMYPNNEGKTKTIQKPLI